MNYKITKKINDKWLTFGWISPNKFGNQTLKMSVKSLKKQLEDAEGEYLFFSMFEDDSNNQQGKGSYSARPSPAEKKKDLDDEILFALILPLVMAGIGAFGYMQNFIV